MTNISKGWLLAALLLALLAGAGAGIGGFAFIYAKGASYLTNDPGACANCHVMQEHYDAWLRSSHRSVAMCNDCHTPPGQVRKYVVKGVNGFNHSMAFTTGDFPDNIRIRKFNRDVAEEACRKCHGEITSEIEAHPDVQGLSCIRCHGSVGHRLRGTT